MEEIIRANIVRFKKLLESETNPTKRTMIIRLLGEEEAKLQEPRNHVNGLLNVDAF
jgi:hypothetical protein